MWSKVLTFCDSIWDCLITSSCDNELITPFNSFLSNPLRAAAFIIYMCALSAVVAVIYMFRSDLEPRVAQWDVLAAVHVPAGRQCRVAPYDCAISTLTNKQKKLRGL
jgi:hypothetical protein